MCKRIGNLKMTESQVDRKDKFKFSTRILNLLEIVPFDTFRLDKNLKIKLKMFKNVLNYH